MRQLYFFLILTFFSAQNLNAQVLVSGSIFDKSKSNYIEGVRVFTTSGKIVISDSLGRYSINTVKDDSIFFVFNAKPTQKFVVKNIYNTSQFDISLHAEGKNKTPLLKEVIVFSKTYKQDSADNRVTYANVFGYHKPKMETSILPGGGVGLDANEIFNLFRFKRNKQLKKFQERLMKEEEEKYVNYRFNKTFVRRITQLKSPLLDTFMVWYRPTYFFASTSSELVYHQYIINASYQFKRLKGEVVPPSSIIDEADLPKQNWKN